MMWSTRSFFTIVFAALFCSKLTVMSKAQTVFTIDVINGSFKADFDVSMFEKFYSCLCDGLTSSCTATVGNDGSVITVEACPDGTSNVRTYSCQALQDIIDCSKSGKSNTCVPQIVEYEDFCGIVILEWNTNQQVKVKSLSNSTEVNGLDGNVFHILATYPVSPPLPIQIIPVPTPGTTQPSLPTTKQHGTTETIAKDNSDEDNNDMAIIIGAAVGGAVFVIIVVTIIIIIVFRRRKQKSSSSLTTTTTTTVTTTTVTTTTTNNKDDDTDIYPYGDSSLNNVGPNNIIFNNLNSSPDNATPDMYATVDPNKKLNKKKTSLDTNNVDNKNQNKSNDNKNQFRPNVGYTEVDINNGADHYQGTSDSNNDQGVSSSGHVLPPPPPDPPVKPKYYNTFGETGEDPSAAYAEVVKKNKNKDESAVKGEGAGSNPTRDPSGYEEAVPHTETQYAEVDLSAKAKPKLNPTPDGVYSKLHDPLRKVTDVYNEWPAADNAGE